MLCSVIILNYFGEKVLTGAVRSLQEMNFPKKDFEVIIVDNNSKDNSRKIIKELEQKYGNVRSIFLPKNYGFSKGNNIGIKSSKGDYVALLNNDCIVSRGWLRHLMDTAVLNPNTFAVASKILLYPKYLKFEITIDQSLVPFYAFLLKTQLYSQNRKKIYLNLATREGVCKTEVPYDPVNDKKIELQLIFNIKKPLPEKNLRSLLKFSIPGAKILEVVGKNEEVIYKVEIDLQSSAIPKRTVSKIQNAGIIPFHDGYARDIGAIVRFSSQHYEYDEGQYDKISEIYAFCGAAVLLNKKVLNKIGLLDETFFMYYEDVELSERARLKGYKIFLSPKAVVRHMHALSSKEGSGFFTYNVEKGRLLHVFYNFPLKVFYEQYTKVIFIILYTIANFLMSLRYLKAISKDKSIDKPNYKRSFQFLRILIYFVVNFLPLLFIKKFVKKIDNRKINENLDEILKGKWYFN